MPKSQPDFWGHVRQELSAGPHWADRMVVLAYAIVTGLVVVGFTLVAERASEVFGHLSSLGNHGPWLALAWTPLVAVAVLWVTRRFAPGAQGSGIPQVVAALEFEMASERRSALVSVRLSLWKIVLVSGGLLGGLSIGREGPTVQVGAGIMQHARRWLSGKATIDSHDLMVAGAAAGIAAAFNTPLGGVMFALEQLSRRRSSSHSGLVITAIVFSGLVAISFFGNQSYFGEMNVSALELSHVVPGLAVAVAAGLAGGLFSRLLVLSLRGTPDRLTRWRTAHPLRFAAACGLAVAIIGLVTQGATAGAGYLPTRALLEGHDELPIAYTVLKFMATWISAWSGVPAGVFAPSLAIGAGIGHDVAALAGLAGDMAVPLVACGMVGFLAATSQGPLTAFIIVMEMVSGHRMVLSLMATALIASALARWLTRSMYLELAETFVDGGSRDAAATPKGEAGR